MRISDYILKLGNCSYISGWLKQQKCKRQAKLNNPEKNRVKDTSEYKKSRIFQNIG